jgi:hypothetical protein
MTPINRSIFFRARGGAFRLQVSEASASTSQERRCRQAAMVRNRGTQLVEAVRCAIEVQNALIERTAA